MHLHLLMTAHAQSLRNNQVELPTELMLYAAFPELILGTSKIHWTDDCNQFLIKQHLRPALPYEDAMQLYNDLPGAFKLEFLEILYQRTDNASDLIFINTPLFKPFRKKLYQSNWDKAGLWIDTLKLLAAEVPEKITVKKLH